MMEYATVSSMHMGCVCPTIKRARRRSFENSANLSICLEDFSHSLSDNVSSALPLAIFCLAIKRGDPLVNATNEYSQIPVKIKAADACCWYL